MKKAVTIIALLVLVCVAGTIGLFMRPEQDREAEAIRDAIEGFYKAYNDEDFEKCLQYIVHPYGEEGDEVVLFELAVGRTITGPIKIVAVKDIEIHDGTATALVAYEMRGGQNNEEADLAKVDGEWKLDARDQAQMPTPTPEPTPPSDSSNADPGIPSEPQEIVEAFYGAIKEGRYEEAEGYLSPKLRSHVRKEGGFEGIIQKDKSPFIYTTHFAGAEVDSVRLLGKNEARVTIKISWYNKSRAEKHSGFYGVYLEKEKDGWRITYEQWIVRVVV